MGCVYRRTMKHEDGTTKQLATWWIKCASAEPHRGKPPNDYGTCLSLPRVFARTTGSTSRLLWGIGHGKATRGPFSPTSDDTCRIIGHHTDFTSDLESTQLRDRGPTRVGHGQICRKFDT